MENVNHSKVRVRIAPSPTGFVHIGNLRTILYNYLYVRNQGGSFIVRIEDTDQTRFVEGALEDFLRTLDWAGLEYDEGPFIENNAIKEKGDFGPYIQSKRLDIYNTQIKTLLDKNKAYHCFCTKERIDKLRDTQREQKLPPKYDGHCRNLTKEQVEKKLSAGEPHIIRFKMPEDREVIFDDDIRGTIKVNTKDLDDFVLIKTDNYPTYHFANVIDDHQMKITHVMRGDEWIASTPKHVLLYEAFGWQAPIFAHLPQILNKNKKKMSKRDGDVSVKDFIKAGYLKEALINFIALLGWNAGTEQEIYTLDEMTKQFSLDNIHKAGAIFDNDKLDWINGMYIRNMSAEKFTELCIPHLIEQGLLEEKNSKYYNHLTGEEVSINWIRSACGLEQERIKKINQIGESLPFIFTAKLDYDGKIVVWKKSDAETTKQTLVDLSDVLNDINDNDFQKEIIEKKVKEFIDNSTLGNGDVMWPFRVALSGLEKSPGPFEIAAVIGKQKSLERLMEAIIKL